MITIVAIISIIEGIQVLVIAGLISSFIPIATTDFDKTLFPIAQARIKPEREMELYRLMLVVAVMVQAGLVFCFNKKFDDNRREKCFYYIAVSALWLAIQGFAIFKIFVYQDPAWARGILYVALVGAIASRIFFPELIRLLREGLPRMTIVLPRLAGWGIDAVVLIVLVALLTITNQHAVLGYLRIINQTTAPMDMQLFALLTISAAFLFYLFIKQWLNSHLLAIAACLFLIKISLFHLGQHPIALKQGTWTLAMFPLEGLLLWALWQHMKNATYRWLILTYVIAAISLCVSPIVGVAVMIALFSYGAVRLLNPSVDGANIQTRFRLVQGQSALWLIAWIPCIILNIKNGFVLPDSGALLITSALYYRNFFAYDMAFILPVVLLVTLLWVGSGVLLKKLSFKYLLVPFSALYGLCLYAFYAYHSVLGGYYIAAGAWLIVVFFWINEALAYMNARLVLTLKSVLALAALIMLMTNSEYMIYPNVFNTNNPNVIYGQKVYEASLTK